MSELRLRVNAPQVIHETIDGEVIIINLATGNYYSAKGSGADIWELVGNAPGLTAAEVADALASRFGRPAADLAPEIDRFLDELRNEDLVAFDSDLAAGDATIAAAGGSGDDVGAFTSPVLEKYTDMQDLVLLDPVHEVDTTGWPQPRPETSAA
jgi:Coenzyme PQQ synthesis protein D (PqqD)